MMPSLFRLSQLIAMMSAATAPHLSAAEAAADGVWHFLNDPVAQHHDGKTFMAGVDGQGSPKVQTYHHDTGEFTAVVLRNRWKVDDHVSPTLMIREQDGHLLAFYARGSDVIYHVSDRPHDADAFGPARSLSARDGNFPRPVQLTENGEPRIFLFYRDTLRGNRKRPALRISDDGGESWSEAKALTDFGHWMYPKAVFGPDNDIHLLITSNPHHMSVNNLYYIRYQDGAFTRADGTRVAGLEDLPLTEEHFDRVYASPGDRNAPPLRASDLAVDSDGHPVIVGVKYEGADKRTHQYAYFTAPDGVWRSETLATTQPVSDHPKTGWVYFGGIGLDPAHPRRVFYAAETHGVFEIFTAEKHPDTGEWSHTPVTRDSKRNQLRPWGVHGLPGGVIWLEGELTRFNHYRTTLRIRPDTN